MHQICRQVSIACALSLTLVANPAMGDPPTRAETRALDLLRASLEKGTWYAALAETDRVTHTTRWAPLVEAHADALAAAGQPGPESQAARHLSTLRPMDVAVWLRLGRLYAGLRFSRRAMTAYETALKCEPDNMEALLGVARIALLRQQPREAADPLRRALALADHSGTDPKTAEYAAAHILLGRALAGIASTSAEFRATDGVESPSPLPQVSQRAP